MRYLSEDYLFKGNLFPVKEIIKDCKNGKEKTIAFLGASVTYGESVKRGREFPAVIQQKWKEAMHTEFAPQIINASKSGTLSGNALFSMDELLEKKPDLVFLDYSVNDPGQAYLAETFEAVVYRFLSAGCAVAILLFCNERGSCTKGAMMRVARQYQIPVLDIGKMIMDQIAAGELAWEEFALDYVHPNNDGHEYIAENLFRFFSIAEETEEEEAAAMPEEPCFGGVYREVQFIKDIDCCPEGVEYEIEFSSMLIEYTQRPEPSEVAADVYIDGVFIRTIELYSDFSWNNRVVHSIYEGYENSRHNVKIVPAEKCSCSQDEWELMNIKLAVGCFPDDME